MIIRGFENEIEMRNMNMPATPGNMIDIMPTLPNYNVPATPGNTPSIMPTLPDSNTPATPGNIPDVMPTLPDSNTPATPGNNVTIMPTLPGENVPATPGNNVTIMPTLPGGNVTVIPIIPGVTRIGYIRYFHAAPFTGPVDIYINGQLAVTNLSYLNFTDYFRAIPGYYRISVYPANGSRPILNTSITIERNMVYTAAIIGERSNVDLKLISDRPRNSNSNFAYARFIDFSPNSPDLDVYIDGRLVLSDLAFTEVSNYLSLNPGLHSMQLKIAGTNTIIFDEPQLNLQRGQFYSIYIVANLNNVPSIEIVVSQEGISYLNF